jgi:hypothetical protein
MTLGHSVTPTYKSAIKFQHHTNSNYNNATTISIDLGHPAIKHHFCQHYIFLIKAPKEGITGKQSMDHTCSMIQIIETMKGIFWSIHLHGDVSIIISASEDMYHLTNFDDVVDHPALLVPQFQWTKMQFCLTFRISWRQYLASSMRNHLSWHTTFPFTKFKLVLHCIFGHTLSKYHPTNRTPVISKTICFVIPKFYLRSVHPDHLVKKMKPACSSWNRLFDRLQDSTKLQTRAIYEILHHVLEDHHFYLTSNSKGNTKPRYNRRSENNTTEQHSPNSTPNSKENTEPFSPEVSSITSQQTPLPTKHRFVTLHPTCPPPCTHKITAN